MSEQQKGYTYLHVHSKPLRALATLVSYIFHPIFMPVTMAFILYRLSPVSFAGVPMSGFAKWLGIIAFINVFFPLVTILLMKGLGFIQSIMLHEPKERGIALLAIMIYYFWASHVFNNIPDIPLILKVLLLGSFWGVIAVFMINIFFKVSMHTAAAGGSIGILIVLMIISPVNMVIPFFIALIIAGIIGTARMILGAHMMLEIWLGYIVGILVQLGAFLYMR